MAHLTLTGVSDDGKRLLLVSDAGVEFTVDIDPLLRTAVRGEQPRQQQQRPGHLEMKMDSTLRPRDIQARIRAGETPEAVAEAAQTSVDRIMAFAAPVMAERAHAADRAQRSSVRRRAGDPGSVSGARTLGDAVPATCVRRTSTPTASSGTPGGARTGAGRSPAGTPRASARAPRRSPTTAWATTSPPRTTTRAGCWGVPADLPERRGAATTCVAPGSAG